MGPHLGHPPARRAPWQTLVTRHKGDRQASNAQTVFVLGINYGYIQVVTRYTHTRPWCQAHTNSLKYRRTDTLATTYREPQTKTNTKAYKAK